MAPGKSLTILVASTQRRGAEVFCELLSDALRQEEWDTELVALAQADGASVRAQPLSTGRALGKLDLPTVRALRTHLRRRRPSVLLAFGSSTLKYGVLATRLLQHRPRLAYASIGEPLYWARRAHQRASYRALLTQVDLVLSVSARMSSQLGQALGVPAQKLRVTPTGVPASLLEIPPMDQQHEFRVLFIGSLSTEKDPMTALRAFAKLSSNARLRILGAGPLESSLRTEIAALGLKPRVELAGSVDRIEPHLEWSNALLLTSQTEGLPAVVLEAAAASRPVVAYDVGGVGEAVIDDVTGRLIAPGDAEGLVAALARYSEYPAEARRAGAAGREMVAARFTIEAAARTFDAALTSLTSPP